MPVLLLQTAFLRLLFALLAATLLASCVNASPTAPFPTGANTLFAGHSFFVPVARHFDEIAQQNGFEDHQAEFVFSGGQSGSPRALWQDLSDREAITAQLATGEVDLFGLTVFSSEDSRVEDYARWFDLALEHNPDTQFFIGHPQTPEGAATPAAEYAKATEELGAATFAVVEQLRALYPDNPVYFINYGQTAVESLTRFEAGDLPDVLSLLPDPVNGVGFEETLFTDVSPGHGGAFLQEVGSLSWLELLYGAKVESLAFTDYESDVIGIVNEVVEFNLPFQVVVVPEPGSVFITLAVLGLVAACVRSRSMAARRVPLACRQ